MLVILPAHKPEYTGDGDCTAAVVPTTVSHSLVSPVSNPLVNVMAIYLLHQLAGIAMPLLETQTLNKNGVRE